MMMKLKNSGYHIVKIMFVALSFYSGQLFSQSDNLEDEKIKADGLAMAYVICDFDLANYYYSLDKENTKLKRDLEDAGLIKGKLAISMEIKYRGDERLKLRYKRALGQAKKKLGKCVKYQGIMDSKAKTEKEEEKETPNK
jgi:hypothetical protein